MHAGARMSRARSSASARVPLVSSAPLTSYFVAPYEFALPSLSTCVCCSYRLLIAPIEAGRRSGRPQTRARTSRSLHSRTFDDAATKIYL
jgi:hypothetical protein